MEAIQEEHAEMERKRLVLESVIRTVSELEQHVDEAQRSSASSPDELLQQSAKVSKRYLHVLTSASVFKIK